MLQHVQEAGVVMPAVAAGIVNTVMLVAPAVYVLQELALLVKMYRPPGQPSKAVIPVLRNARAPQKKEQGANGLSGVVDIVGNINRTKFYTKPNICMDFKDQISQLAARIEKMINQIQTEEATKNALVMPFIQILGYDVFNPFEVNPEFIADLGIKKGEKVDYAIMKDGEPIIIVECKHHLEKLDPHNSQLFRYFHVCKAKFGLLTNGLVYRFYTDLNDTNKMDEKPFFEFNIAEIKEAQIEELKKFHKSYFDVRNISNTASDLKFTNELKALITSELRNPSPVFVKHFANQVYNGKLTEKILTQFTELVKRSSNQVLNDAITDRLKTALGKEEANSNETEVKVTTEPVMASESNIVTTEEEIEGFFIVKSILRETIDPKRITHRDAQSYFAILLDDNNRKTICRLYLGNKKYLVVLDDNKKEVKYEINEVDEIYSHADLLKVAVAKFEK